MATSRKAITAVILVRMEILENMRCILGFSNPLRMRYALEPLEAAAGELKR
jgi:hypothetical protein